MLAGDRRAVGGGEERGGKAGVADVRAAELRRPPRQVRVVDPRVDGSSAGVERATPQLRAFVLTGEIEADLRRQPADQRRIDADVQVGGEDGDAAEPLDPLQQEVDLQVGIAVDRAFDVLGAPEFILALPK